MTVIYRVLRCIFTVDDMFWPSLLAIIRSLTCIKPAAELNNKLLNLKILCLDLLVSCMEMRSLAFLKLTFALIRPILVFAFKVVLYSVVMGV